MRERERGWGWGSGVGGWETGPPHHSRMKDPEGRRRGQEKVERKSFGEEEEIAGLWEAAAFGWVATFSLHFAHLPPENYSQISME